MSESRKKLILVEFNEANFDLITLYAEKYNLKNFKSLVSLGVHQTESEQSYELLEPWIQWVSAKTGLSYAEHRIFRLGDIETTNVKQIYERIEANGLRVGAISPMNAANRLVRPAYFIPDPWTKTPSDKAWLHIKLSAAISKIVNQNSQSKINLADGFYLLLGLLRYARVSSMSTYFKLFLTARKYKWRKALFLDLLLMDMHINLSKSTNPDFATVFLNGLAHIQHHYFYNSEFSKKKQRREQFFGKIDVDPIRDALQFYDGCLARYLINISPKCDFILATGLSQKEFEADHFYYRLVNHRKFLESIGIQFVEVLPRMTRDFEVRFSDNRSRDLAFETLSQVKCGENCIFGIIEKRPDSLFVTLTYEKQITEHDILKIPHRNTQKFSSLVTLVAQKNGEHNSTGYIVASPNLLATFKDEIARLINIKHLHNFLLKYYQINECGTKL